MHYHFRRGPVAFFVMDGRTARGDDDEFPIFGRRQWADLKVWAASSEARDEDAEADAEDAEAKAGAKPA